MRKVAFKTVGCRLNQAETAQIAARFAGANWQVVPFDKKSDAYVVHSCTITGNAERKSIYYVRSIKKKYPDAAVILAGCAVEVDKDGHLKRSGADILVGQKDKFNLPAILAKYFQTARSETKSHDKTEYTPQFSTKRALIKVQDGCDFNCAYCIVPSTRGKPVSRPFSEIINEIKTVTREGFKEIVLTGANLGRYEWENKNLSDLLNELEKIDPLKRIRLSSIEISTTEKSILDHMAESEKLCKFIHLPIQSGDDNILRAMGRRYSVAEYCRIVDYAIGRIPLIGLGTDIIVGFPGETATSFKNTLEVIEKLPFSNLHIFPYSRRTGTKAESMPGQIGTAQKKERCAALTETGARKRSSFARKFIGKPVSVLIETIQPDGTGTGWTGEYLQATTQQTDSKPNHIVQFIARDFDGDSLLQ